MADAGLIGFIANGFLGVFTVDVAFFVSLAIVCSFRETNKRMSELDKPVSRNDNATCTWAKMHQGFTHADCSNNIKKMVNTTNGINPKHTNTPPQIQRPELEMSCE